MVIKYGANFIITFCFAPFSPDIFQLNEALLKMIIFKGTESDLLHVFSTDSFDSQLTETLKSCDQLSDLCFPL